MEQFCIGQPPPQFLIYSSNIPHLLYYSHIPAMIVALLAGFLVFFKTGKSKIGFAFLSATILFFLWSFFDLILWATNRVDTTMFFWSMQILLESPIYIISLYVTYFFAFRESPLFRFKFSLFLLYIPLVLFLSTKYSLLGINIDTCNAIEGFFGKYYTYIVELVSVFFIIGISWFKIRKITDLNRRKEVELFSLGVVLFLLAFSWGNIVGSFTDNWTLAQYGLLGMPVFVAFLAYLIVRFHVFNIKLLATQVLVWGLAILIGSQFFFIKILSADFFLNSVAFVGIIIFGQLLIKSVRREIEQRIKIEELATQRESFIHFLSHEVKGILGKNKDMFALLLDKNNSGATPEQTGLFLKRSFVDTRSAVDMVENLLHSDDFKNGKIFMEMKPFDMKSAVLEAIDNLRFDIETKGLSLKTMIDEKELYTILGDRENITKHVIHNLIDNAIRYTPKGEVTVFLSKKEGEILFSVKDSGIGITAEDMPRLFTEGGHGKESLKVNIHSTGYGLFFAKGIVEAHHGRIWAESEGSGKGTTFSMELAAV